MSEKLGSNQIRRPPNRNVIRADDATIEDIRITGNTGYVTISYGVRGGFNMINMELVTLIVNQDTVLQDRRGRNISLWDLRKGMIVNAVFSATMTFSQPPQARAYRITVMGNRDTQPPRPPGPSGPPRPPETTVGTIIQVDVRDRFLYTVSSSNITDLRRYVITEDTRILNRNGNRIQLRDLRTGQRVRVEHANWQTRSIPPQTVAYVVRVL